MKSGWYETSRRPFKVERVAGWYDIWTGDLPFSQFTLKVVECEDGGFRASPNVFFKSNDGIEYCCGIGNSIDASVLNAIAAFYAVCLVTSICRNGSMGAVATQSED